MAARYPTHEQKHGMYVQLLRDKSEEYLRKAFHKTFQINPTDLYIELKKHNTVLLKLLKKGILNQKQYNLLFPQSKQTDSSKFDTTLLFLLIRSLCGYKAPATGWNDEPDHNDRSEIANLIRLKIGRNKIQHLSPSLKDAEYKDVYLYLRRPLLDLGCPLNDISHARSFKYDSQPAIESFIGREDELKQIHQVINNHQPIHGVVISGIPGVGKTELARKYCQEHEKDFEHMIWVNCNSIANSFQGIAQSLKLECYQGQEFKDLKVIANLITEYFKNEKVLFVFDNCVNGSEDLVDVLSPQHHNIITSQIKSWAQDYKLIELDIWPKDVAMNFLMRNIKQERDLFDQLIDEFNCHPLAMQHAVAFMKEVGMSLKEYLKILSEHKLDVLSEKVALRHGVTKSVFSSFQITIEKIQKEHPKIYDFLSIFSVLEISLMKEEFLKRYFTSVFDFIKAIKLLQMFNMVNKFELREQETITFYTMHSLYQCSIKVCRIQNIKKIVYDVFQMIAKVKHWSHAEKNQYADFSSYSLKKTSVWFDQFQYIWYHQRHLRKPVLQEISNRLSHIHQYLTYRTTKYFVMEILKELYEVLKGKTKDVKLYFIKLQIVFLETITHNERINRMKNILLELERNVSSSSGEKHWLIKNIKKSLSDDFEFDRTLHEGYFYNTWNPNHNKQYIINATWLKENKQYDKALEFFYQYQYNCIFANPQLEIACCFILQGKTDEGLQLVEHVKDDIFPYRIPLQVGRALFDVGRYEQSTEYLNKFIQKLIQGKTSENYYMVLDGCSKLVVQNTCIGNVIRFVNGWLFGDYENVEFRANILICICLIRQFQYTIAFDNAETLLQKQQNKQCSRIWFREGLLIAKHLMRRNEYYQALLIYQMIQQFQNELDIPKQTLDGDEIDVQQCINDCLFSWIKIFNI